MSAFYGTSWKDQQDMPICVWEEGYYQHLTLLQAERSQQLAMASAWVHTSQQSRNKIWNAWDLAIARIQTERRQLINPQSIGQQMRGLIAWLSQKLEGHRE